MNKNLFPTQPARRPGLRSAVALALSVLLTLVLYGASLRGHWCCDDPAVLLHARGVTAWWQLFTDPQAYRALIPYSLQPWLTLSYGADLALWGLAPGGFFAHQLLGIALCGWLLERIAALWLADSGTAAYAAYLAPVVFLVGSPVAFSAQHLMTRHYVEGLALFLAAVWLLLRQLRGGPSWLRWPAALALALAVSAKEVFVPLGLLALVLPWLLPAPAQAAPAGAPARARWQAAWPWLAVLALYVPWRRYMLGDFLGGYLPPGYAPAPTPALLAQGLRDAAHLLWPWPWPVLAALAGLGLAAMASLPRLARLRAAAALVVLAGLLAGPLLPLLAWPGFGPGSERYLLVPWALLALLTALGMGRWVQWHAGRGARAAPLALTLAVALAVALALTALVGTSLLAARQTQQRTQAALDKAGALAGFFLAAPREDAALVDGDVPGWFTRGLVRLRQQQERDQAQASGVQPPPPAWPVPYLDPGIAAGPAGALHPRPLGDWSDVQVFANGPGGRVHAYDPATRRMHEVTAQLPALLQAWHAGVGTQQLSVQVHFNAAQRALHWQLQGPAGAAMHLLSGGALQAVPARFGLRMDAVPRGCFRVRADLPQGAQVYSPLLRLPLPGEGDGDGDGATGPMQVQWQGAGDPLTGPHPDSTPGCESAGPPPTVPVPVQ